MNELTEWQTNELWMNKYTKKKEIKLTINSNRKRICPMRDLMKDLMASSRVLVCETSSPTTELPRSRGSEIPIYLIR